MKYYIYIQFCLLFFILKNVKTQVVKEVKEGHEGSIYYHDKTTIFDYSLVNNLIVFGDSYSEVNMNYETLIYTGNNFCGGDNWLLHLKNLNQMKLVDFAIRGASIGNSYGWSFNKHTLPFQYEAFYNKLVKDDSKFNWAPEDSLFVFWFGINDIRITTAPHEEALKEMSKIMKDTLNKLYNDGARNFLFINVPPFNTLKSNFNSTLEYITEFNTNLEKDVKEFYSNHSRVNAFLYNAFDEFNYLLENYSKFDIKYINKTCIADHCNINNENTRKSYFWYDDVHPTDFVHYHLALDIQKFLNDGSIYKIESSYAIYSFGIKKYNISTKDYSLFALTVFLFYFVFF